jgi:hypothetical protein
LNTGARFTKASYFEIRFHAALAPPLEVNALSGHVRFPFQCLRPTRSMVPALTEFMSLVPKLFVFDDPIHQ